MYDNDYILFSNEKHISKDAEISLDDTLLQLKLVPKIRCKKQCTSYVYTTITRYSVLEIPQFVFVTLTNNPIKSEANTTTTDKYNKCVQEQICIKCNLQQSSFTYCLCCFVVVTKDEQTLLVKPTTNNQYAVYNNDKKSYESLIGYQFDDFITASATNIVLCYKTATKLTKIQHLQQIHSIWTTGQ